MKDIELRTYKSELRLAEDAGRTIAGIAIPYNSRSADLGGFVEVVAPGALTRTLASGNNIKILFDHDSGRVLGCTQAATLTLTDTDAGLQFRNDPPETTWANDLLVSIRRGDINQMSFGFTVIKDSWQQVDGVMLRTLLDIDLPEISIVAFPAYESTSASVRSLEQFQRALTAQKTPTDDTAVQQKLNIMRRHLDLLTLQ